MCLLGLGTVAFHTTLRYKAQLLDEIPMTGVVASAACMLLRHNYGFKPHKICVSMLIPTAIVLLTTADSRA